MARHEEGTQLRHAHALLLEFWLAYLRDEILPEGDLRDGMEQYASDWGDGWPQTMEDLEEASDATG